MNIIVNGEKKEVAGSLTVKGLLEKLDIKPENVVVELNREIIEKERFDLINLKESDRLEIIHFVGGG